ncbi:MAG: T9SS type A sorting domain-containing protein [Bacteroidia bacterium]|nr:T9SS type A sorting domain-containing protein [Bacteroidia bacterium]
MKTKNKLYVAVVFVLISCVNTGLLYAQSVCMHNFKENRNTIQAKAFKSVVLGNDDLVSTGFRVVNGVNSIVADRYDAATCSLASTFIFPYYSGPPATAEMQVIVSNDNKVGIRYFDTNWPGYNYFFVLDSMLNQISSLVLGNSVTNRLIAFANDGDVILTQLSSAPSFGETLIVNKLDQANLVLSDWSTAIYFPGSQIRMVSDIKVDSSNNTYLTGCTEKSGVGLRLFVLKLNAAGQKEWVNQYIHPNLDWNDWLFTKLVVNDEQNVITASRSINNNANKLNLYCHAADGTLLWSKQENIDTLSNKVWLGTDGLNNVYTATHLIGVQNYPSTIVFKYDKNGNKLWQRTLSNFRASSMKVANNGFLYLAGDHYFTQTLTPGYRSRFLQLDANGNTIGKENQIHNYNTSTVDSSYSKYNDVVIKSNGNAYLVGERRDYKPIGTTDYYVVDSYEKNMLPILKQQLPASDFTVSIMPNPASNFISIETALTNYRFTIFDLSGLVKMQGHPLNQTINIETLTPGMYFVRLACNEHISILKIVKQ